jgi:hypothetical protein
MQNNLVDHQPSKEFLFSDPEKKFKKLVAESKIATNKDKLDNSADGSGPIKPSVTAENLLNPKMLVTGTDIKSLELYTMHYSDLNNSNLYSDNKSGCRSEKYGFPADNLEPSEEIDEFQLEPLAGADPQVAWINDGKIQKSDFMESSIFSPNNSVKNRTVVINQKKNLAKVSSTPGSKTGKNDEKLKKNLIQKFDRNSGNNSEDVDLENSANHIDGIYGAPDGPFKTDLGHLLPRDQTLMSTCDKGLSTDPTQVGLTCNTLLGNNMTPTLIARSEDRPCDPLRTFSSSLSDPKKPPLSGEKAPSLNDRTTSSEGVPPLMWPGGVRTPLCPENMPTSRRLANPEDVLTLLRPATRPEDVPTLLRPEDVLTLPLGSEDAPPQRVNGVVVASPPLWSLAYSLML